MCNKSDAQNPGVRARLVALEVQHSNGISLYTATPPFKSKRMLASQWASERKRCGLPLKLSFVDVRTAYFIGKPKRPLFIRFPPELGMGKDMVGMLHRPMYSTRDAGSRWEQAYSGALIKMGFIQGVASTCCFRHPRWGGCAWGGDFSALGTEPSLQLFEDAMQQAVEVKLKGRLGPEPHDQANEGAEPYCPYQI